MPHADTAAMQVHLDEVSRHVTPGAHALILLDKSGWHTTCRLQLPANLTLLHLPPRSPELNPTENVWQYLRQTWLSNRVFDSYAQICEACCLAWNKLTAETGRITSIATREWAHICQRP
jgi:transposase